MKQMIYVSQPFGFDEAMLAGILSQARRNNRKNDITGALICRNDMYIQLVEGPDAEIDALFARIAADDRHTNVRAIYSEQIETRMFPEWDMLHDGLPSMTWSPAEIDRGAIEKASADDLRAIFGKIAAKAREGHSPG